MFIGEFGSTERRVARDWERERRKKRGKRKRTNSRFIKKKL